MKFFDDGGICSTDNLYVVNIFHRAVKERLLYPQKFGGSFYIVGVPNVCKLIFTLQRIMRSSQKFRTADFFGGLEEVYYWPAG